MPFKQLQINDLVSTACILVLVTLLVYASNLLERIDNLVFDIGQRLTVTAPPEDVIIVAIDQQSLSAVGRWPWSRQVHADLLKQLNQEQPAAVGFDIIFAEPEHANPLADIAFASAMQTSQKVVLPVLLETTRMNGQMIETLPMPALMEHTADLGRVHAVLDQDSIARSVYLYEGLGAPVWQLFSQAVINVAEKTPTQNLLSGTNIQQTDKGGQPQNPFTLKRAAQRRINFLGPPGHFQHISYHQVLKGEYPKGLFNDKIVLIGATALGMNDLLTTPVSGQSQPMAGVEFHANVLTALRNQQLIVTVPAVLGFVVLTVIALMPLLWLPKSTSFIGFLSTMVFMMAVTVMLGVLPKVLTIWLPPSAALVSLLLAYPIWSWRKLEAAQQFLDYELQYLKTHLIELPGSQRQFEEQYDQFDARIAQVRTASEQLRFMNEDRKETLAFISHDLRAPLARALSVLSRHSKLKSELYQPLSTSLALAEDFLQASRAEMMDSREFETLDFSGLVHQAIDDAYEASKQKQIRLVREISDDIIWVRGNFGLLHRAISNLVLNAVKFSPASTDIVIKLSYSAKDRMASCTITDFGPGIPATEQQHLFKRFSRIQRHASTTEGAGLGLYFVKTVAEKHLGNVQVQSEEGVYTTFTFSLPWLAQLTQSDQ